jgi:alpha-L-fucosidase
MSYDAKAMTKMAAATLVGAFLATASAQFVDTAAKPGKGRINDAAAVELFRDRGLGLFIHWGVDGTLGGVISHSLVGASPDYLQRFFETLPGYFNPDRFQPDEWARLAKLAGFRYVVFTAKHHAGFCMWETRTTDFSVMHTPYGKDLLAPLVAAFRKQGIAIGIYFSPDDFWWLYQHHITINRHVRGVYPQELPEFMDYTKRQLKELLTNYGPIDYFFFDGPAGQLTDYAWQLQPNLVITRGVMETPEQYTPGVALPGAWEGNLTMGTEWPWKATNERYKSGSELIDTLIETRAKGGNLLLNIGPKPNGTIPDEQDALLREIALWNFVNGEAIRDVRPWIITNENNVWFTKKKGEQTVYAFITREERWRLGEPKTIVLRSMKSTPQTTVSVLGQSDALVEYKPEAKPQTIFTQDGSGMHITVYRAQRLYTDRSWPNPLVVKLTNVEPGMYPPEVSTLGAEWNSAMATETLHGSLANMGNVDEVKVGFQFRAKKDGTDLSERTEPWTELPTTARNFTGEFEYPLSGLVPDRDYEFRARVQHPLLTTYGQEKTFRTSETPR